MYKSGSQLPMTQRQASDFGDFLEVGSEGKRAEQMCWENMQLFPVEILPPVY